MARGAVFDFRLHQEKARVASFWLVTVFVSLVAGLGLTVGFGSAMIYSMFLGHATETTLDWMLALQMSAGTAAVIALASTYKLVTLGGDGGKIAESLGAEEVSPDTTNRHQRRYLNIVDEMAIASGLPRPRVYVLKQEAGINAFAAGSSPDRAAVAVTNGALAMLDRDELSGVVAHEMAHVANMDTRLNGRLMSMVFGLVALSTIGRVMLQAARSGGTRRSNDKGNAMAVILGVGLLLVVLGILGVFAGRILQAMVSRKRELLADATAIQLTRNPDGLARALKKIGAASRGSMVAEAHAEEARHMFFASSQRSSFAGLLATHPPLTDRIKAIDPAFDPTTDIVWNGTQRDAIRSNVKELAGPWGSADHWS